MFYKTFYFLLFDNKNAIGWQVNLNRCNTSVQRSSAASTLDSSSTVSRFVDSAVDRAQ